MQAIALLCAGVLAASAFLYVTTGYGTPFPGCWPQLPRPYALFLAIGHAVLAAGFVVAATRDLSGISLKDAFLVTLFLALFSFFALNAGAYALVTGIARIGGSGCLRVGPPWSYGIGLLAVVVGAVALLAAAILGLGKRDGD